VLLPRQQAKLARGAKDKEPAMAETLKNSIAFVGIDIGKNSFHVEQVETDSWNNEQVHGGDVRRVVGLFDIGLDK
jgi:hypothetical protein